MAEIIAGVGYAIKEAAEGVALLAKGVYDPTLPLKATLQPISSINVPLAFHTVSVIKGRAFLFGGKRTGEDGAIELADNAVHVVILPSTSGIDSVDYKKVEATEEAPCPRYGHSAAVIDDRIHIFGGNDADEKPLEENGRVFVYDTSVNKWSHLDPAGTSTRPDPRHSHASVASEHPQPAPRKLDQDILPQQPPDPEITMPEIPDANSYGTLIIQGGQARSGNNLVDTWSFDVSTRTWMELPSPPAPSSPSPSLAIQDLRLYTFSAGQTSSLDVTPGGFDDIHGKGELGLTPRAPWKTMAPSSSSPEKQYPGERVGASMFPVTTGQGRNYLLLIGGKSQSGETLEDIWVHQLQPEGMTAASFKDAARMVINKNTNEAEWSEVRYYNQNEVMIQEGQAGRGIGVREGFAAAADTGVDSASVLLWGGIGSDGKPRGDGLMITIDI